MWALIYVIIYNLKEPSDILHKFLTISIKGDAATIMYYVFVYCEFTLLIPLIDKMANSKFKYLEFVITPAEIILMRLIPMVVGYQFSEAIRAIMHKFKKSGVSSKKTAALKKVVKVSYVTVGSAPEMLWGCPYTAELPVWGGVRHLSGQA